MIQRYASGALTNIATHGLHVTQLSEEALAAVRLRIETKESEERTRRYAVETLTLAVRAIPPAARQRRAQSAKRRLASTCRDCVPAACTAPACTPPARTPPACTPPARTPPACTPPACTPQARLCARCAWSERSHALSLGIIIAVVRLLLQRVQPGLWQRVCSFQGQRHSLATMPLAEWARATATGMRSAPPGTGIHGTCVTV